MPSATRPSIGVVTIYEDSFRDIGDITCRNKFDYCQRHGYSFHVLRRLLAAPPPTYSKLPFLKRVLPLHDWLVWIDADALIMNHRTRVEDHLDERCSLIIGEDWNGIQAGVFFLKRSDWSFDFLDLATAVPRSALKRFTDQEQMARTVAADPRAAEEVSVRLLKQSGGKHDFNCYTREDPTFPTADEFRYFEPNDFILHFAGMGGRGEFERMRELAARHAAAVVQ